MFHHIRLVSARQFLFMCNLFAFLVLLPRISAQHSEHVDSQNHNSSLLLQSPREYNYHKHHEFATSFQHHQRPRRSPVRAHVSDTASVLWCCSMNYLHAMQISSLVILSAIIAVRTYSARIISVLVKRDSHQSVHTSYVDQEGPGLQLARFWGR